MVVILAMGIGLFAPPFGLGYYAACTLGGLLLSVLIVAAIPWISIGFVPN